MTLSSYGTHDGVAGLSRIYTKNGIYTGNTNPTDTLVGNWLVDVSAMVDTALRGEGFITPVTQEVAARDIKTLVEGLVADLCRYVNGTGRFINARREASEQSPLTVIRKELLTWASGIAGSYEELGVPRGETARDEIGFRTTDYDGKETSPIFRRGSFGNEFD